VREVTRGIAGGEGGECVKRQVSRTDCGGQRNFLCLARLSAMNGMVENVISIRRRCKRNAYIYTILYGRGQKIQVHCAISPPFAAFPASQSRISHGRPCSAWRLPCLCMRAVQHQTSKSDSLASTNLTIPLSSIMKVTRASPNKFRPVRYDCRASPFSSLRTGYCQQECEWQTVQCNRLSSPSGRASSQTLSASRRDRH
jgi:hypothetical protein